MPAQNIGLENLVTSSGETKRPRSPDTYSNQEDRLSPDQKRVKQWQHPQSSGRSRSRSHRTRRSISHERNRSISIDLYMYLQF